MISLKNISTFLKFEVLLLTRKRLPGMSLTRLSPLCLSWAFEKHKRRKKTKQDKIDKHIPVFHDLKLHWIRNLHEILFGLISLWNCSCSCFKPQDFAWNSKFVASTFWLLKRQILFVKEYFTPFFLILLFSVHIQEFKWINCKAQSVFHTCFCSGSWRLWSWWTWGWCRVSFRVQILPKTGS